MTADPVARALTELEPATPARRAAVFDGAGGWASALAPAGWARVASAPVDLVVLSLLQEPGIPARRGEILAAAADRLVPTGHVLVIDHNRPRRWRARLPATVSLWWRGLSADRGTYPTAREIAANGFEVERLLLGRGERVQVVVARRREVG